MKILFLTFYFRPDLCAGSFRNSPLADELLLNNSATSIHVVTTIPNRYKSFSSSASLHEIEGKLTIDRVEIPLHRSGFIDQIISFNTYFWKSLSLTRNQEYDIVYASSSRLFTAFLGRYIAWRKGKPLYLDIRDIFRDTIKDVLKSRARFVLLPFLDVIERFTFSKAAHINLVSEGFRGYFEKYKRPNYTFFTNGIDDVFINNQKAKSTTNPHPVITYAGNIGEGQGLERIIPMAAKKLPQYIFRIIGDGGSRNLLEVEAKKAGVKNIEIIDPVTRDRLIEYYQESDFLFFHLNDYKAFEKVLPSKVFEYGAFDLPIIAGVGGYAAQFVEENLTNYILFDPQNVDDLVGKLLRFKYKREVRTDFIDEFSRKRIMQNMADSIFKLSSHE